MGLHHISRSGLPAINLVRLKGIPIIQQLHLEEKLLRTSSDNWCIFNDGADTSTIVMGISGIPKELVEVSAVLRDRIPVIKRFSGGGTVLVDKDTIFMSLICNKGAIPGLQPYPRPIMRWTAELYGHVFSGVADFHLHENDYAFGDRKFGGNAQSITKHRWIHHTSFLWDYQVKNMEYLRLPQRAPEYRLARKHVDFLCPMKDYLPSRLTFMEKTITALENYFSLTPTETALTSGSALELSYSTRQLTQEELIGS